MFGQIGPLEIALVLIIALIVFGPKRLPELGKSLGKGINEFKDGISNLGNNDDDDRAVHEVTEAERGKVAEDDAETVDAEVVTERHD